MKKTVDAEKVFGQSFPSGENKPRSTMTKEIEIAFGSEYEAGIDYSDWEDFWYNEAETEAMHNVSTLFASLEANLWAEDNHARH